jgi:predicted PurR-regulated permease PerM
MKTQLGVELWKQIALFVGPPLLIAIVVIWRAIWRVTNHPDGSSVLERPKRKRS